MNLLNLDFAKSWQLLFQDPATPIMEGIIDLHHNIFFFLLLILFLVLFLVKKFDLYLFSPQRAGIISGFSFFEIGEDNLKYEAILYLVVIVLGLKFFKYVVTRFFLIGSTAKNYVIWFLLLVALDGIYLIVRAHFNNVFSIWVSSALILSLCSVLYLIYYVDLFSKLNYNNLRKFPSFENIFYYSLLGFLAIEKALKFKSYNSKLCTILIHAMITLVMTYFQLINQYLIFLFVLYVVIGYIISSIKDSPGFSDRLTSKLSNLKELSTQTRLNHPNSFRAFVIKRSVKAAAEGLENLAIKASKLGLFTTLGTLIVDGVGRTFIDPNYTSLRDAAMARNKLLSEKQLATGAPVTYEPLPAQPEHIPGDGIGYMISKAGSKVISVVDEIVRK